MNWSSQEATSKIMNKVQKFKGYVHENVSWSQDGKSLEVHFLLRDR
jgi:hypothetical protein